MNYSILLWDMCDSTRLVQQDEDQVLAFLDTIAQYCLESVSEMTKVEVVATGDGQQITFPDAKGSYEYAQGLGIATLQYAESLQSRYPDYRIRCALGRGELRKSSLGDIGAVLWQLNDALHDAKPGALVELG